MSQSTRNGRERVEAVAVGGPQRSEAVFRGGRFEEVAVGSPQRFEAVFRGGRFEAVPR
ncbi:MAG: hypothetical protein R6W93_16365 [Candidatus Limnocylindrales bacterium]